MATSIHQEVTFSASAEKVYGTLTDEKEFSTFTGAGAENNSAPGGSFSLFGGAIVGINLERVANKRIVQAWRVAHWEEGVFSLTKFELTETSASETKLVFSHIGFPEKDQEELEGGWHKMYWDPIKEYLKEPRTL